MNALREIIGVDDIELDADLDSADAVLARLAAMLSRQQGLPASDILRGLEARERLGSTALGHAVAIPHARVPACQREAAVLLRTRSPIVFGAPDARPVTLFLGLVVPAQASEQHLRLLAAAAELLDDRARRVALKAATSPAAVRAILDAMPDLPR
ncbi:MAG TPA: PTS sugar transporter subunit IIA [Casimicrobiaceae bacterium]